MDDSEANGAGADRGREADGTAGEDTVAGSTVQRIHHARLTRGHLPHPREPFDEVVRFAYTFDGYEHFGMRLCGEMANRALRHYLEGGDLPGWLEGDLDRLRGCLYFEARRWILLAREPDTRSLIYAHRLIDAVGRASDAADTARTSHPPSR